MNKVTFGFEPDLPYSIEEALNRLRINISFLGQETRRILIISSEPNEGKSFITYHLWKQMATAGDSSVLLDLDMRKSNLIDNYQIARVDGLPIQGMSHYLSGKGELQDAVLSTDIPAGDILPNVDNLVNPSMLLEGKRFPEMLNQLSEQYRYLFMDAPPLSMVSDGELIASHCDGAILVVRAGFTPKSLIRSSMQQLERANCPLIGMVLNRVEKGPGGYYKKYYGKYYGSDYYSRSR